MGAKKTKQQEERDGRRRGHRRGGGGASRGLCSREALGREADLLELAGRGADRGLDPLLLLAGQLLAVVVGRAEVVDEPPGQRQRRDQVLAHHFQDDEAAGVLEALDLLEPRHRVQQLDAHRPEDRPAVQEEQVAPAARVLDRVLDEVDDRVRLELGAAAEAEVAWGTFRSEGR